jgi:tetratricopeptide (TPR) repeat protein/Zn-dependent protease with chaperone function
MTTLMVATIPMRNHNFLILFFITAALTLGNPRMAIGNPVHPTEPGAEDYDFAAILSLEAEYDDLSRQQIVDYLSALAAHPKQSDVHYKLGRIYQLRRDYDQAAVHYQQVISLEADHLWAHYRLAEVFVYQGWNYEEAIKSLQKVLTLSGDQLPKDFPLDQGYAFLGLASYYHEDYQAAEIYLQQALRLNPTLWGAYYWLGITQYQLARYEEAQANLTKVLNMDAGYDDFYEKDPVYYPAYTHYYLGLLAAQKENVQAAEEHMHQALTFQPHNTMVIQYLASLYTQQHKIAQAIELYTYLLPIYPENIQIFVDLADLYDQQGNTHESIALLEKVVTSAQHSYYRSYAKTYQKRLIAFYQKVGDRQAVNRLLKEVYRFSYWYVLVFVAFLVLLYGLIIFLGRLMIQRLPAEEGEERFKVYFLFRQQFQRIFIGGSVLGSVLIYFFGWEYLQEIGHLPMWVLPFLGIVPVMVTVLAASVQVDRRVRKTSASLWGVLRFYVGTVIFIFPFIGIFEVLRWTSLFEKNLWGTLGLFGTLLAVIYLYPTLAVWLIKKIYRAAPLEPSHAELHETLQSLAKNLRVSLKSILSLDTRGLRFSNACAVGIFPQDYHIMFTTSLLKRFQPQEITTIFLHELGHLKHHHVRRKMHLLAQTSILAFAAVYAVPGYRWPLMLIFLGIYLWLAEKKAKRFEYQADAFVVQHTEDPAIFVKALERLYAEAYLPRTWNPASHLGLDNRIKALQELIVQKANKGSSEP